MVNLINASKQDEIANDNEKEITVLNSAVKYREETLEYNKLRNQVEQEYYHKIHGCSVKSQE
ncbi:hypothetical protein CLU83_2637 [Flavobacterium sp. 1]|uniref:hypothetical protein n=1 Tax=Flavobacterium sp. 1 TaxID=2035200 RepID=UPI000CAE59F7|nr:hypothetical protein [Flavobacterium sp. 1]PJJ09291.1 hypothetical protein CLU83_2637 [Flavobacterium sp. 1]